MAADFWDQRLADYGVIPQPQQPRPETPYTNNGDNPAYAAAALRNEAERVALAPKGTRNHTLNVAAFNLASLAAAGALNPQDVDDTLTIAARQAGLDDTEIRATLASGRRGSAEKVGARTIPEPAVNVTEVNSHTITEPQPEPERDLHQLAVQRKAYELQILDEARAYWTRQRATLMGQQSPPMIPMPQFLAIPDEDATYRVTDLLPIGARVLLAAQYKAGKTSMVANLLRCLADGDTFLGQFPVTPVNRILLIDTELDERMLRRWLRDQGIRNQTSINILSLRGRLSTFNIVDDRTRADWATRITGADLILLDCLRPCLDALGLSEDKEAGVFLTAFDALCKECGADEAVMVHHMGHNSERSRGDSRLLDWPDVLWKIVRDTDQDGGDIENGARFFSAIGRDVHVPESQLDWQPETRTLTICGGGRAERHADTAIADIMDILSHPAHSDGLGRNQLVAKLKAYGHSRNLARLAIQRAVDTSVLVIRTGPRNANIHFLNPSHERGD